jgi:hypothetical protein
MKLRKKSINSKTQHLEELLLISPVTYLKRTLRKRQRSS